MISHTLFSLVTALGFAQQTPGAAVEGRVLSEVDGRLEPVAYAEVALMSSAGAWGATTDASGRYLIDSVSPGRHSLRVRHLGFRPRDLDVAVPGNGRLRLDLILEPDPVRMTGLRVRVIRYEAEAPDSLGPAAPVDPDVQMRAFEVGTGMAETGVADFARGLSGNDPSDPTDVLFMRGSSVDLKLVLLDGAPVYTPFHVGGLIPSFDPDGLSSADLFLGAAPARYDGGLSYILDLEGRPAPRDRVRAWSAVDLVSARAGVSLPFGQAAGLRVSSRGLHRAAETVMDRDRSPYGYADAMGRLDVDLADRARAFVTAFWNRETVALDFSSESVAPGQLAPQHAAWGNRVLSAGLWSAVGETRLDVGAALTAYDASLPLATADPLFARGRVERARMTSDLTIPRPGFVVRTGASWDRHAARYQVHHAAEAPDGRSSAAADASVFAAYGEASVPLGTWGSMRGGIRATRFSSGLRMAPRVGVTWLLSDQAALSVSAGRYHQLVPAASLELAESLAQDDADAGVPPANPTPSSLLEVAGSNHLVVSLDQELSSRIRLGLDGYVKRFDGLGRRTDDQMNASGMDLRVRRDGDRLRTWLGYSLSWYWASDTGVDDTFTGRHLLSAGIQGEVGGGVEIDVRFAYGDGLPLTAVPLGDAAPVAEQDDFMAQRQFDQAAQAARGDSPLMGGAPGDFLRVDAEVSGSFAQTIGGHPHRFRPYVKLLNALDRRDSLFYYFERWRGGSARPIADLPLLPVVGLEWRF